MAAIAIIGPGAVGGSVAGWLARDPSHSVSICARTAFGLLVVETPEGRIESCPNLLLDPSDAGPVDWVLVATKAYDTKGAAAWLARLVSDATGVAILQNGVEHRERFRGIVPDRQILPVIVDIPAERTAPGRIVQRRFGTMLVPEGELGRAFVPLFADTRIEVSAASDFAQAAWRKLAINCAGAVNALALRPAIIAHDAEVAEVMRAMVEECVAVARAEGIGLPEGLPEEVVAGYRSAAPTSLNSIHADRLAGRPMEADARNGVVARLGRKHGIPTPLNHMAWALLEAACP